MNDLYVLDPASMDWTNLSNAVSGTPPAARAFHGLTSANGMLYVHGGVDVDGNVLSDLHAFDPIAVAWTDLSAQVNGTVPTARCWHGFTSADGKLYVHGGQDTDGNPLSDLHSFDPVAKVWTDLTDGAITPPSARYSHDFTSAGKRLYVHNGVGYSGTVD